MPQLVFQFAVAAIISYTLGRIISSITTATAQKKDRARQNSVAATPQPPDVLGIAPEPGGPQIGVFGHGRVGGRIVLDAKSGTKTYMVIVQAGAPVTGVNAYYINNQLVTLDGSGNVIEEPWDGGAINIKQRLGAQLTADAELLAAFPGWTADHVGKLQTYCRIILDPTVDPTAFESGVPDFSFDITGFKCYDPRVGTCVLGDDTTYVYSDTSSIVEANYAIHPLGQNAPTTDIDWTSVATAANIDDQSVTLASGGVEPRYSAFVYWTTDERHEDVFARIGATHAGGLYRVGATRRMATGAWTATTAAITTDDYEGEGLTFSDSPPISDICNGVRGKFTSPLNNYEPRDFPQYQDAAALAEDNGRDYWLDLDLRCVTSASQAQRLARIAYNKARYGASATVQLQFTHFDVCADDTITITDDLAAFTAKTFRVLSDSLSSDYIVTLALEYEASTFYDWTAGTDEAPFIAYDPVAGETGTLQPPGLTFFNTTAGVRSYSAYFASSPSAGVDQYEVDFEINAAPSSAFITAPASPNPQVVGTVSAGAPAGTTIRVRARSKNTATGQLSAWSGFAGTPTVTTMNGLTITTTPYYVLPPPYKPLIKSTASRAATLTVKQSDGAKSTHLRLYENTINDFSSATLISTVTNGSGGGSWNVTGTVGQVKYYWAKTVNVADGVLSPESGVTLVVF